jgi:hypothetical protein
VTLRDTKLWQKMGVLERMEQDKVGRTSSLFLELSMREKVQHAMNMKRVLVALTMLCLASPLGAQMGMGPRMPNMSGVWHPVVGAGGAYEVAGQDGKKNQLEITVVGQEEVNGKTGYWLEMATADPRSGGMMYMKMLLAAADNGMTSTRMVMQPHGQDPMEMDMNMGMMNRRQPQTTPTDIRDKAERVGTEAITVPAGTFSCEHYRMKDGSADVWISDKVAPWGLVKTQGKDSSMILTKVITDAKDHITGTPKKFDPRQMIRERMGQQGP